MKLNAGEVVGDRFVIERLVGAGGMAAVYRARDRVTGAPVALKTIHDVWSGHSPSGRDLSAEQIERFTREAEMLADLRHPGVVRYVAHGAHGGRLYLAMEWLEGEDLADRLARGRLPLEQALDLCAQAADALAVAHERGIVHRDIKPGNIFLVQGEVRPSSVKLLDFGIARFASSAPVTRTGLAVGTPSYMAPEQARGARDVDARADVFSLGCVLFECVVGRVVFAADHPLAVLAKVLIEEAPRASELRSGVPAWLDDLIARMLAKDPEARPTHARQVAAEIARRAVDLAPPSSAETAGALTTSERRLRCVLMASWPPVAVAEVAEPEAALDFASAATMAQVSPRLVDEVRATLAPWGACLEMLGPTGLVATLTGMGPPTDQTALAARCALALREIEPIAEVAVATGWGVVGERAPVGEVIDRAAALLAKRADSASDGTAVPVLLDEMTEQLLDERFEVVHTDAGAELAGERADPTQIRTLLGKPSPCVGRETELAVLGGLWRECVEESLARAILVTAPAGVGKSRLAAEFLSAARQAVPGAAIWSARADPISRGSPFALVAAPLRRAVGILEGEPLELSRDKLGAAVARHAEVLGHRDEVRIRHFLGELAGAPFDPVRVDAASAEDDDSLQIRAARRDPVLMGDQMRRAWEDFVAAECKERPMLLIIEDLHWGDLPSVHVLDGALKTLAERPFMLLALARPEVQEVFPTLWSARDLQQIRLSDLTRKASARLVRRTLGEEMPESKVNELVERSGGNAFYLEELIRAEAAGVAEVPDTVVAMAQARLERLEPEARRVLRAASVFGQVFWPAGVAKLLGSTDEQVVVEWLGELLRREVVVERPERLQTRRPEYSFRHALLGEAAYGMLPEEDLVVGHRLAAEWLESVGERDALVLAEHHERGGERGRAVGCYLRAAEQALEGGDLAAAIERAERAVAGGASGEELGAARVVQAEAVIWRGQFEDVRRYATEALAHLAPATPLYFRAMGPLAFAMSRLHDKAAIERLVRELCALPASHAVAEHAIALARCARELYLVGESKLADQALERALRLSLELPARDRDVVAWIEHLAAVRPYQEGRLALALRHADLALAAFRAAGDLRFVAALGTFVGLIRYRLGQFQPALEIYGEAVAISERLGLTHVLASVETTYGRMLLEVDRRDEAETMLGRGIERAQSIGDLRTEAEALTYLSALRLLQGDLDAADHISERGASLKVPHTPVRSKVLAQRARILVAMGRTAEAVEAARAAIEVAAAGGPWQDGSGAVRLTYAEALRAAGDLEGAREAIGEARAMVFEAADRIGDDALRDDFLHRVRENARTLELSDAWEPSQP